jgi:hypothetical protein
MAIKASPDYKIDKAIFIADYANNRIFRSTDNGMHFALQVTPPTPGGLTGGVLVVNANTLFVGSGTSASVTHNNGTSWDPIVIPGAAGIFSFAKSPAYSSDKTVLLGTTNGLVFISQDDGASWTQVPVGGAVTAFGGANINVAFDSGYAMNGFVIAADSGSNGVYRINAAMGTAWAPISMGSSGSINANVLVPGIQMAADGTLYVSSPVAAGTPTGTTNPADSFAIYDTLGGASGTIVLTSGAATITAAGTGLVERDAFTITAGAADDFTLTCGTAGAVTVTATSGSVTMAVTTEAGGTATTIVGDVITFGDAGDIVTVTATAAGTAGTITATTGASTDAVGTDVDGDATVVSQTSFNLPYSVRNPVPSA